MAKEYLTDIDTTSGGDTGYSAFVKADENFETIDNEIYEARGGETDLDTRLDGIDSSVNGNTSNILINTANIATNTANIATNTSDIATNIANISTNTSDIAAIKAGTATFTTTKIRAYLSSTQNLSAGATDIVRYDTENRDDNSEFASMIFTAKVAGDYDVYAQLLCQPVDANHDYRIYIWKNSEAVAQGRGISHAANSDFTIRVADIVTLTVGDTISIYVTCDANAAFDSGSTDSFLTIMRRL